MVLPSTSALWARRDVRGCAAVLLVWSASCGGSPVAPPPPPPQLTVSCPAGVEASSLGGVPVPITYAAATASGGTGPVSVACTPAAGSPFPSGATTVTCTASDNAGRQASCTFGVTVATIPLRLQKTRFLAFGDSLTEGKLKPFGAALTVDAGPHSYPTTLRRLLTERYAGQSVTVENEGFAGERATDSFRRYVDAIAEHRPEVVLLMHGVNDLGNDDEDDKILSTARAIDELTAIARSAGLAVFLATLPPLGPGGKSGDFCPECVAPLNDLIRSSAAARGAVLVDVFAAWGSQSGLMGPDGIHPTEAGYEAVAKAFFEAITRTLEAPPGMRAP